MQITVTDQLPALQTHLNDIYQRLNGDLTPLMQDVGALLERSTVERFDTKKAPSGASWEQLRFGTELGKAYKGDRKAYRAGKKRLDKVRVRGSLLVDRGDLMKSITYHATSQSVAVGTPEVYGKYHQVGTVHMPARPFLGLSADDEQSIQQLINQFMRGALSYG